jgi:hypothetical protein
MMSSVLGMNNDALRYSLALAVTISALPWVALSQMFPGEAPLKATLCEIETDPSRFAGRRIELRATLAGEF